MKRAALALALVMAGWQSSPARGPPPTGPTLTVELGDPMALVDALLERSAMRAELAEGALPALIAACGGLDEAAVRGLLGDPDRLAPWTPRWVRIDAPIGFWRAVADWLLGARERTAPPFTARVGMRSPGAARVAAVRIAGALGLVPEGQVGRWRRPEVLPGRDPLSRLLAPAGQITLARDGERLMLRVDTPPPSPIAPGWSDFSAAWRPDEPAVMADPAARMALAAYLTRPESGGLSLTADAPDHWMSGHAKPGGLPTAPVDLAPWLPEVEGYAFDDGGAFPPGWLTALLDDRLARALRDLFGGLEPAPGPGFLLVAGAPEDVRLRGERAGSPFETEALEIAPLAVVLPATDPAAALLGLRRRVEATLGVTLRPHATRHGGPTWRLPDGWAHRLGFARWQAEGDFELHAFAGEDAVVISTDDALSEALIAARGGARGRDDRLSRHLTHARAVDDGGGDAARRALAGVAEAMGPFLDGDTARRAARTTALARAEAALGRLGHTVHIDLENDRMHLLGRVDRGGDRLPPLARPLALDPPSRWCPGAW